MPGAAVGRRESDVVGVASIEDGALSDVIVGMATEVVGVALTVMAVVSTCWPVAGSEICEVAAAGTGSKSPVLDCAVCEMGVLV